MKNSQFNSSSESRPNRCTKIIYKQITFRNKTEVVPIFRKNTEPREECQETLAEMFQDYDPAMLIEQRVFDNINGALSR